MITAMTNNFRAVVVLVAMMAALVFASGVALAVTKTCEPYTGPGTECLGTNKADALKGTDGDDYIYGRKGGDTLRGLGNHDELYGQEGADELLGGPDSDDLTGGPGGDAMRGGIGNVADRYFAYDGWGKDHISDGSSNNSLYFTDGPHGLFIAEDLIITLGPGAGPEVKTVSGTDTIEWEENVISLVSAGYGDDMITGNSLANHIYGGGGKNTIYGGSGNDIVHVGEEIDTIYGGLGSDEIHVDDGNAGDVVDCGEDFVGTDNDVVYHDPGDLIDANCEIKNP